MPLAAKSAFRKCVPRRCHRILSGLFLAVLLPVAGLYFSGSLLLVENSGSKADVMVVLGGEPIQRPPRAVELFKQGVAPVIVVSGEGDCDDVRRLLEAGGVPAKAIHLECGSSSTVQNARYSIPLLRSLHARRVIIVTSWFHSRRALYCFRHYAPDIEFFSQPTVDDRPRSHWPSRYERGYVLEEYVKSIGYWVVHGVRPF